MEETKTESQTESQAESQHRINFIDQAAIAIAAAIISRESIDLLKDTEKYFVSSLAYEYAKQLWERKKIENS